MRNNFLTSHINKTKHTGCAMEAIQHNFAKYKFKNCERGAGGDHTSGQIFGTVNGRYLRNGQT